jgi:DNA polymerase type B, organellar and viral
VKPIYTFDTETDPFHYGRIPKVFTCGIWNGESFYSTWGKKCVTEMRTYIENLPPGIIYAHNGGRFDFYYLLDWFDGKMSIINSRIIKAYGLGHEWRDSYAIYPEALASYKKDEMDYTKLEFKQRNKHKQEILEYLESDCVYLHEIVTKFWDEFGDNLTIGATAMKQLKKLHKFDTLDAEQDSRIRSRFYFGGRVQCFEKGILTPKKGNKFHVYDVNQSYPTSMRNYVHPVGAPMFHNDGIGENTFFLTVRGYAKGCFPTRSADGGLFFPVGVSNFSVSIYEYRAAIETGQFDSHMILECVDFEKSATFDEFVDTYHGLRKQALLNGDKLGSTFYKRVCNSAYGKFAQCPDNYFDYMMRPLGVEVPGYDVDYIIGSTVLWKKESDDVTRYNVATGASITGCSRSFLIRALAGCERPIYCDTDSIICESIGDTECDPYKLGAWKVEKSGDKFAVAGRKLYALFDGNECVKYACKGVRLTPKEILTVAGGAQVHWKKDAPTFSLNRGTKFIHREIRMV